MPSGGGPTHQNNDVSLMAYGFLVRWVGLPDTLNPLILIRAYRTLDSL